MLPSCAITPSREGGSRVPPKPSWYQKLDRIISEIDALVSPIIDRHVIEQEFGLSRRGALHLMNRSGAIQTAGKILILERKDFLSRLRKIQKSPDLIWEVERRHRLSDELTAARKMRKSRAVVIQKKAMPFPMALENGTALIRYDSPEDLLSKLYAVAQFAASEYEEFESLVRTGQLDKL
jgi:hypothetical protein